MISIAIPFIYLPIGDARVSRPGTPIAGRSTQFTISSRRYGIECQTTQEDYAQQLIDEYRAAGVPPEDVFPQSFNLDDVLYWITNEPAFGNQAVFLDGRYDDASNNGFPAPDNLSPSMAELVTLGVQIIAPPMWALVTLDANNQIVASPYAAAAQATDLDIITWTIERSQPATSIREAPQ